MAGLSSEENLPRKDSEFLHGESADDVPTARHPAPRRPDTEERESDPDGILDPFKQTPLRPGDWDGKH